MRFLYSLLLIASTAFALSAQEARVKGVQITWFGSYQVTDVKIIEDKTTASGRRREGGTIIPPKANSDRIAATSGGYFGFGYKLLGSPSGGGAQLRYVRKYPAPGLKHRETGQYILQEHQDLTLAIDQPDLFMGFVTSSESPTGQWTFQIWHGSRMLVEKSFTVYRP